MYNSFLNKIGVNEFRIDFETDIARSTEKSVVVDGETYTKIIRNTYKFNSKADFEQSEEREPYFKDHGYDKERGRWERKVIKAFQHINNEIYYVWNYTGLVYDPMESLCCRSGSTVGYVRLLSALIDSGMVKHVHKWSTFKDEEPIRKQYNEIIRSRSVCIPLYKYGFNNTLFIYVYLYRILKLDLCEIYNTKLYIRVSSISNEFPDLFPKKMFRKKLSDIERIEIAMNILNKSINLKQQTL